MKRNLKFGRIGALLAAMLLVSMALVPAVSAQNSGTNDTVIVNFDGMTEKRTNTVKLCELGIPSSIKKSDIIVLNLIKLNELLKNSKKVPIHIKGKPYVMELNEIKVNAPGVEEGTFSYTGSIAGAKNSEIVLTLSDSTLVGRITLNNVDYTIESIKQKDIKNTDRILHIVYSSEDVVGEGGTIPIDYQPYLPAVKNNQTKSVVGNQNIITQGIVDVGVLVATDNQWITDEPDWKTKHRISLLKLIISLEEMIARYI